MKIKLPHDKTMDLRFTKVMGTIALSCDDRRTLDEIKEIARSYIRAGAEFLEVGTIQSENGSVDESRLLEVIETLLREFDAPIAISSNNPQVIISAIKLGVSMIISSDGLSSSEEATKVFKDSEALVCLHCEPHDRIEDDADVVALISEIFYTKIDGLLNAGVSRKRILIDPSITNASVNSMLRLLGRLESFRSFALPICVGIPRQLPQEDYLLKDNHTLSLTAAIFCASDKAVQIIRTSEVSEIALAIGFWQVMTAKTKPYRLTKTIVRRLRNMRDALRGLKINRNKK